MNQANRSILVRAVAGVLTLILVLLAFGSMFTVDQAEQAVVLQFGRPVGTPITEPGLHWKTPFMQEVRRFDRRILSWDGDPTEIPTRGREFISVTTTARWKIVDALQFLRSVRDESGAQSRLDDIIDSVVRDTISSTDLVEIVRSADWAVSAKDLERAAVIPDSSVDLTRPIRVGRERLEAMVLAEAGKSMAQYGTELVDVRITRLNYIESVRKQVFTRMISERQRAAEMFRSEGQGETSRIRGDTARELATVRSEAKRKAEVVRGDADAEATRIYSEAYSSDPEFFAFLRTLQSYETSLGDKAVFVLGADSDYFRFVRAIDGGRPGK